MSSSIPATPSRQSTRVSSRAPSPQPSSSLHPQRRASSPTSSLRPGKISPGSLTPTSASALPPHLSVPTALHLEAGSSASSISNLDGGSGSSEGILLKEVEADVEVEGEVEVFGNAESGMGDEESKKMLRDQLRKTLSSTGRDAGEGAFRSCFVFRVCQRNHPDSVCRNDPVSSHFCERCGERSAND